MSRLPRITGHLRTAMVALPLLVFAVVGLLAPLLAPADPTANDLAASLLPPSTEHLLGTDQLGRDQLSRILHGARISLTVTAAVLAISVTVGVVVGTIAGYLGGRVDRIVARIVDMAVSLPGMLVALAVVGVRGAGTENLVIAMSLWAWSPYARIARARVAGLRDSPHLDALRLLGAGPARILGRHLLPPALGPCLVYASTDVGAIVLGVATLSFLGLGIPPPHAEWGQMLVEGRPHLGSAWWLAYPPGIAITAIVFASNLLGERLAAGDERPSILRWVLPTRPRIPRPPSADASPAPGGPPVPAGAPAPGDAVAAGGSPGAGGPSAPGGPHAAGGPSAPGDDAVRGVRDGGLLRVRDLVVSYPSGGGRRRVVAGVDYEVARGEILAIVGESGSGKTTSALAPFGLLDPSATVSGSATLRIGPDVHDFVGLAPSARRRLHGRRVGVVFQDSLATLNPLRTIGAHVDEAVRNAGRGGGRAVTRRVTEDLLRLAGLTDPATVARRHPHQLSGGMRQRAQIAVALAGRPALLVADEPTSALDVTVQSHLLDLLARLREELDMSMIIVSHDLAVVTRLADRVAVVYAGRIVESGPLDAVTGDPAHPYTRGLLDAVPRPGAAPGTRFRTMPGRSGAGPDDGPGCAFAPRCPIAVSACAHETPIPVTVDPRIGHRSACLRAPGRAELPAAVGERDGG
ncbi:dipeptide/oligopeptide/nickel ABC transporter permease/ATP-binding protein [Verrucosispora sp. SN26_14.1]|uniref:dipeptide/oligopeptide/nickel ABC transporter permease/ATP-binding protein n=1 Tax=Verrucosispora sp. SN26_14.1 TaxID=2527879 RepID=UPI00103422C3|nr:dipeptide/oligopeptide/nickel ABC transporter permease/ATP-binding protein [Verrucosispora sp. SN26_14.1]TBL42721.1 dipeptide/oligopeptide/nickel ABC transporter permease/ATP-binding protein [Verrucosispora sp. SN26_14.1]